MQIVHCNLSVPALATIECIYLIVGQTKVGITINSWAVVYKVNRGQNCCVEYRSSRQFDIDIQFGHLRVDA